MERTTELQEIKQGEKFTGGDVRQIHELRDIAVVEYQDGRTGAVFYHPYIDGRDTAHCFSTLDEALIGVVALKHDGRGTRAIEYIFRMLKMGE